MSNYEETKPSKGGIVANILAALAFLALGICLLVLNAQTISKYVFSYVAIAVGALFICFGLYNMIKYFFRQEFKSICNYGFTYGVVLAIIGSGFLFLSDVVAKAVNLEIIIAGVLLGTVMLQHSFALFYMRRALWFLSFIFGVAAVAASGYFFLIKPQDFFSGKLIPCLYLIIVGGASLLSLLFMVIGLHTHKKDSKKNINRNFEEAPVTSIPTVEESIFEDEPVFETPVVEKVELDAGSDDLFDE